MKKICFLALAVPMLFTGCVTVDSVFGEADAPVCVTGFANTRV